MNSSAPYRRASRVTIVRPVTPICARRGRAEERSTSGTKTHLDSCVAAGGSEHAEAIRVYPDLSAVERYGALHVRNRLDRSGTAPHAAARRRNGVRVAARLERRRRVSHDRLEGHRATREAHGRPARGRAKPKRDAAARLRRLMTPRIGTGRKLDYAVTAALSLATIAGLASDRVGLVAFARRNPRCERAAFDAFFHRAALRRPSTGSSRVLRKRTTRAPSPISAIICTSAR